MIAISQRNDENKHGVRIDSLENSYINYFEKLSVRFLVIPNSSEDISYYFENFPISAVILSGGGDLDPKLYGGKRDSNIAISEIRDKTEKKMLELAIEKKLPVLGICRGMQFINVFFDGKLINYIKDNISEKIKHVRANHLVRITDKKTAKLVGEEFEVNSYNNHGVTSDTLSKELNGFAVCEDGVIEGIYHPSLPIAGIQWHPERESPDDKVNEKIINAFLKRELFWKK